MNRRILLSALCLVVAATAFAMAIFEIAFPEIFSICEHFGEAHPGIYGYRFLFVGIEVAVTALLLWPAGRLAPQFAANFVETAARLGFGGMFIFASLFKIQDPQQFAILVAQYQMLPAWTVNIFALILPQLEFWAGLALIVTPWCRETAALLTLMFVMFLIALGQAVVRDLGITCGCFDIAGAVSKTEAYRALVRDVILIIPCAWLISRPDRNLWRIWKPAAIAENASSCRFYL